MAFEILNDADVFNTNQAELDSVDLAILVAAYNGSAVVIQNDLLPYFTRTNEQISNNGNLCRRVIIVARISFVDLNGLDAKK